MCLVRVERLGSYLVRWGGADSSVEVGCKEVWFVVSCITGCGCFSMVGPW